MGLQELPGTDWVEPEDFFVVHAAGFDRSFWLDGSSARSWSGSMSYVGWLRPGELSLTYSAASTTVSAHVDSGPGARVVGRDIFAELALSSGRYEPGWGWVGFFGYACRSDLPSQLDQDPSTLDACWLRATRWVAFDHARRRISVAAPAGELAEWSDEVGQRVRRTRPAAVPAPRPAEVLSTCTLEAYSVAFGEVQRQLRWGNSYEVNLTYRTVVASAADPLDTYRRLRRSNPAPYTAYLRHGGTSVACSSPERFATVDAGGRIETRPIKGTTARGSDPSADSAAATRLRTDPKYVSENLMIVDLLRNDLSQVCTVGSVAVPDLMHVESYASVHQLVSTIRGRLRPEVSTLEALRALLPAGSMTGAPKLRTMQIITDVEDSPRGVYAGALGWLGDDGRADLAVVIRTLVHRDDRFMLGTGGGVTVRSVCAEEYDEAGLKARNLLRALGL